MLIHNLSENKIKWYKNDCWVQRELRNEGQKRVLKKEYVGFYLLENIISKYSLKHNCEHSVDIKFLFEWNFSICVWKLNYSTGLKTSSSQSLPVWYRPISKLAVVSKVMKKATRQSLGT